MRMIRASYLVGIRVHACLTGRMVDEGLVGTGHGVGDESLSVSSRYGDYPSADQIAALAQ